MVWFKDANSCDKYAEGLFVFIFQFQIIIKHNYHVPTQCSRLGTRPIRHWNQVRNNDVITSKGFYHYWPFVRGDPSSRWILFTRSQLCTRLMFSLSLVWKSYCTSGRIADDMYPLFLVWKKLLYKPSNCRWFERPWRSHYVTVMAYFRASCNNPFP